MVVSGKSLDDALRAARARFRGDPSKDNAAAYAHALSRRDYYRGCVYARFDLETERQASLATAIYYAKHTHSPRRSKLRKQIAAARAIRLEIEDS